MPWWLWFLLGLVLAVLEIQVPTNFYLLAVGIGAGLVGLLLLLGAPAPAWVQWLLFSGFSVGSIVVLQRTLVRSQEKRSSGRGEVDSLVGELARPESEIAPGGTGRAELRGSSWTARNTGETVIAAGSRCRVVRVEGLTIWLRPETTEES